MSYAFHKVYADLVTPEGAILVVYLTWLRLRSRFWGSSGAELYAPDGRRGMLALFAGKNMYKHCDHDAYLESVRAHKDGFWLRFVNFMADHAVGFRRISALARSEEEGWDVHGKML